MKALGVLCLLLVFVGLAWASNEESAVKIKNELVNKGYDTSVNFEENSSYGIPAYVITINMTDEDYITATRKAMIAAASVVTKANKYPTGAIIELNTSSKMYRLRITNIDMVDILYETYDTNLDASKARAEKYFDSADVTR
jgi:hypothetical protein